MRLFRMIFQYVLNFPPRQKVWGNCHMKSEQYIFSSFFLVGLWMWTVNTLKRRTWQLSLSLGAVNLFFLSSYLSCLNFSFESHHGISPQKYLPICILAFKVDKTLQWLTSIGFFCKILSCLLGVKYHMFDATPFWDNNFFLTPYVLWRSLSYLTPASDYEGYW